MTQVILIHIMSVVRARYQKRWVFLNLRNIILDVSITYFENIILVVNIYYLFLCMHEDVEI